MHREAWADRGASEALPEEKGPKGNMKSCHRSAQSLCKWLLNVSHAIITRYRSVFSEMHQRFISYRNKKKENKQQISPAWQNTVMKCGPMDWNLKTNLHYLLHCSQSEVSAGANLQWRYMFCNYFLWHQKCFTLFPFRECMFITVNPKIQNRFLKFCVVRTFQLQQTANILAPQSIALLFCLPHCCPVTN